MDQWSNIQTQNPNTVLVPKTSSLIELHDWYWVCEIERFVNINYPTRSHYKFGNFNLLGLQYPLPKIKTNKGKQTKMLATTYIQKHLNATNVVDRIVLDPSRSEKVYRDSNGLAVLNIFNPPPKPHEPITESPDIFRQHLLNLFNNQVANVEHFESWIAHILFKPQERINHGILISGGEGQGKGRLVELLSELVGDTENEINVSNIKSDFQDWLVNKTLVIINEIEEAENHALFNKIKTLFTSPRLHVNPKGEKGFHIINRLQMIMLSNSAYPVAFSLGDRRIFYCHSELDPKKLPKDYYQILTDDWNTGGRWAYWKYLKDEVLPKIPDGWHWKAPPKTIDHQKSALASMHPAEYFIREQRAIGDHIFAEDVFFKKRDLISLLKEEAPNVMRNRTKIEGIFKTIGLQEKFFSHDGQKALYAWFKESDAVIRPLIGGNTKEAQKLRKDHFAERPPSQFDR